MTNQNNPNSPATLEHWAGAARDLLKPRLPSTHVAKVFARLQRQQGAKFLDNFAGQNIEAVMDEWALALHGYRGRELDRGCDAAARFAWALTLPAFQLLARPCLDPEAAWWEAVKCLAQRRDGGVGDWSHPAVWRASTHPGMSIALQSGEEYRRHKARWTAALDDELSKGWVQDVPAPLLQLPYTTAAPAPMPENIREEIDRLKRETKERMASNALAARAEPDEPTTDFGELA